MPLISHWLATNPSMRIDLYWALRQVDEIEPFSEFLASLSPFPNVACHVYVSRAPVSTKHSNRITVPIRRASFPEIFRRRNSVVVWIQTALLASGFVLGVIWYALGRGMRLDPACKPNIIKCRIFYQLVPFVLALAASVLPYFVMRFGLMFWMSRRRVQSHGYQAIGANDERIKEECRETTMEMNISVGRMQPEKVLDDVLAGGIHSGVIPVVAAGTFRVISPNIPGPESLVIAVNRAVRLRRNRFEFHRESHIV
jgi:hypothetical protein